MDKKDKMSLYNAVRTPPPAALKKIEGGRLKGMTDINPMWRIKALTEQFGPCGQGWKTVPKKYWLEPGANGEISAFCEIELYYRLDSGEWSEPLPGFGGAAYVSKEKSGLYTNDECFKMAYTDAISVACKALGYAADIYWQSDKDKYSCQTEQADPKASPEIIKAFYSLGMRKGYDQQTMSKWAVDNMGNVPEKLLQSQLERLKAAAKRWPDVG